MVLQSPMVFAARTTEAEGADVKEQVHVKSDPVLVKKLYSLPAAPQAV
jgi:hypothetical protein